MIKEHETGRCSATLDELKMIFDRSISLRLAEKNRIGAAPEFAEAAKKAEKAAKKKWRDATDRILCKPP